MPNRGRASAPILERSDSRLVVKNSIVINAPLSKGWDIIASAQTWRRWMLVVPEVEAGPLRLGSKVWWKDESGQAYLTGIVTALESRKRFVLELQDVSWPRRGEPGEVTYALTLSEADGRTRVVFTLCDLSIDPEAQQWYDVYSDSHEFEAIKEMAEKG